MYSTVCKRLDAGWTLAATLETGAVRTGKPAPASVFGREPRSRGKSKK